MNPVPPVQDQTPPGLVFWTSCPSCKRRHLYPLWVMGRAIKCTKEGCMADFFAFDDDAQATLSGKCTVSPKEDDQNHGRQNVALASDTKIMSSCKKGVSPSFKWTGVTLEVDGNSKGGEGLSKCTESIQERKWSPGREQEGSTSDVEEILQTEFAKSTEGKSKCMESTKERKWFREREQERSATDVEQISPTEFSQSAEHKKKRKQVVTADDQGLERGRKGFRDLKQEGSAADIEQISAIKFAQSEECKKKGKQVVVADGEGLEGANEICLKSKLVPEVTEVAETDFHDFDTCKREGCFAADQMWALYDEIDTMPRYYAWVNKVYSPGFKVQMTWLNYSTSNDQDGIGWNLNGLPIACGNFVYGQTVDTEAIDIFSHRIEWAKRTEKGLYQIHPRKGEIWALFRNWDVKWGSGTVNNRKYDFDYVEVLSHYNKKSGAKVAYLSKMEGFASLFKTDNDKTMAPFCIPPKELLRFSHRVPSYKLTGEEREGVPRGSFELDPASLPVNIEQASKVEAKVEATGAKVYVPAKAPEEEKLHNQKKGKKLEEINTMDRGGISKFSNWSRSLANVNKKKVAELNKNKTTVVSDKQKSCDGSTSVPQSAFTCPADSKDLGPDGMNAIPSSPAHLEGDTVYYNFDDDRYYGKFKTGQIWALYCEMDELPKNYGKIKNVELSPVFKLDIQWLESCNPPKGVIPLVDRNMPICCGTFEVACGKADVLNDLGYFSHQLSSITVGDNLYNILPREGDIWALYKDFSSEMRCSDLKNCRYHIVEVIKTVDARCIEVLVLQNVTGLKTVVQAKKEAKPEVIPWAELYKFSHQIPSFKLADAKYGNLNGCWELDPKSVPVHLCSTN